jgi:hypothetical protein
MDEDLAKELLRHAEAVARLVPNAIEELRFQYVDADDAAQTMSYSITRKRKYSSDFSLGEGEENFSGKIITYLDLRSRVGHSSGSVVSEPSPSQSQSQPPSKRVRLDQSAHLNIDNLSGCESSSDDSKSSPRVSTAVSHQISESNMHLFANTQLTPVSDRDANIHQQLPATPYSVDNTQSSSFSPLDSPLTASPSPRSNLEADNEAMAADSKCPTDAVPVMAFPSPILSSSPRSPGSRRRSGQKYRVRFIDEVYDGNLCSSNADQRPDETSHTHPHHHASITTPLAATTAHAGLHHPAYPIVTPDLMATPSTILLSSSSTSSIMDMNTIADYHRRNAVVTPAATPHAPPDRILDDQARMLIDQWLQPLRSFARIHHVPSRQLMQTRTKVGKIVLWIRHSHRLNHNPALQAALQLSRSWNIPILAAILIDAATLLDLDLAINAASRNSMQAMDDTLSLGQLWMCRKSFQQMLSVEEMVVSLDSLNIPTAILCTSSSTNPNQSSAETQAKAIAMLESWIPGGVFALVTDEDSPLSDASVFDSLARHCSSIAQIGIHGAVASSYRDWLPAADRCDDLGSYLQALDHRDKEIIMRSQCLHDRQRYEDILSLNSSVAPVRRDLQLRICSFSDTAASKTTTTSSAPPAVAAATVTFKAMKISNIKYKESKQQASLASPAKDSCREISLATISSLLDSMSSHPASAAITSYALSESAARKLLDQLNHSNIDEVEQALAKQLVVAAAIGMLSRVEVIACAANASSSSSSSSTHTSALLRDLYRRYVLAPLMLRDELELSKPLTGTRMSELLPAATTQLISKLTISTTSSSHRYITPYQVRSGKTADASFNALHRRMVMGGELMELCALRYMISYLIAHMTSASQAIELLAKEIVLHNLISVDAQDSQLAIAVLAIVDVVDALAAASSCQSDTSSIVITAEMMNRLVAIFHQRLQEKSADQLQQ